MRNYDELSLDLFEFNFVYGTYARNKNFYTSIKTFAGEFVFKSRYNMVTSLRSMNNNEFDFSDFNYVFINKNGMLFKRLIHLSENEYSLRTKINLMYVFLDYFGPIIKDPELKKLLSLKDNESLFMNSVKLVFDSIQQNVMSKNSFLKYTDITVFVNRFRDLDFSDKPELKSLLNGRICVFWIYNEWTVRN